MKKDNVVSINRDPIVEKIKKKKDRCNQRVGIRSFDLNELNPAEYNPRKISDEAFQGLCNSIRKLQYLQYIVVNVRDDKNVIIAGHQRYKALVHCGFKKIDCIAVDYDKKTEKEANVALNSRHIEGEWDHEKLIPMLDEFKVDQETFEELRFDVLEEEFNFEPPEEEDFAEGFDEGEEQIDIAKITITHPNDGLEPLVESLKEVLNRYPDHFIKVS